MGEIHQEMTECYIGIGGNLPATLDAIAHVVQHLRSDAHVHVLTTSRLYQTTPVSDIPQPLYFNAACRFYTPLALHAVWEKIQCIEIYAGKKIKEKNAPRIIDIDLLFYGNFQGRSGTIELPHPEWNQRLFVLMPLSDLTKSVPTGQHLKEMLAGFSNPHGETVHMFKENI